MKVTAGSWPQSTGSYKTTLRQEDIKNDREYASEMETDPFTDPDMDALSESLKALSSKNSEKSGSGGFKAKASAPDDSVGQLASMLARAESRIDVQQVASKAMRALTNLKMSAAASDGKDAKKIAQMIKRMEKLIKRIQKKLMHLAKEEQLEIRQQKAEKQMQEQKAKEIQEELTARRKRRRKDEQNYAMKEMAEDGKNAASEMVSDMVSSLSSASPAVSSGTVPDLSSVSADITMAESVSIDISV